jgi:hypothetical protein
MPQPFIITGLPRSRTAWMATLCNTVPGAMCWHEPTAELSWRDALRLLKDEAVFYAGISDAVMAVHLREILAETSARILIVERDIDEVVASLSAIGLTDSARRTCEVLAEDLRSVPIHPSVKRVAFDQLSDAATVHSCLWHLMPGAEIRADKISEMQKMNIQTDVERIWQIAKARGPNLMVETFGDEVSSRLQAAQ